MAAPTVIELSACNVTWVLFKAPTTVEASIELLTGSLVSGLMIAVPPASTMLRSVGSTSQRPVSPWGARVLTLALLPMVSWLALEVSTRPPFPVAD